ncbi:MAG: hypothetical protein JXA77_06650, partial [Bacteroidales bacterium]|nr:hypothetical protein [Bacteroidales bacterium]
NADGGIGMQVFWNKSPIAGIAIIKPRNINHNDRNTGEGIFSIEYSEEGTEDYEAYMIIEVANLPLSDVDPFAADNLKMFVGKNGDQIDVYGNSNHPNAKFNYNEEETSGFNWAFVASGFDSEDIAVAEVGLPASGAELSTRIEILEDNSMQKVLSREFTNYIVTEYPQLEGHEDLVAAYLAPYLSNTEAPGFFGEGGFVQAGTAPNEKYAELITSIESLTPFNPKSISELSIEFK